MGFWTLFCLPAIWLTFGVQLCACVGTHLFTSSYWSQYGWDEAILWKNKFKKKTKLKRHFTLSQSWGIHNPSASMFHASQETI